MSKHDIINDWIKCYLIGAMEKTASGDAGRGWRSELRPQLERRIDKNGHPIYVFDPTLEEQNKVGYNPLEFHKKVEGWIATGKNDLVKEGAELIWRGKDFIEKSDEPGKGKLIHIMGDTDYVMNSNFLILKINKGDRPCGTYGEAYLAFIYRKPIYVIQTMNRIEYPQTLVGWVFASGGGFFTNQAQLLEYLDKTYELKVV